MEKTWRKDLIYPKLSYQIVGILFEVYNDLGAGLHEKYYQRAMTKALTKAKISFREQAPVVMKFQGDKIGKYFIDFIIENRVIVELKKGERFSPKHIFQVVAYLKATKLKLGILAHFGHDSVKFKRILNL
ncbi:GxxExxY protein [Patescibacteria group bacterium]|nr:GxxExxY protein [Patescibacteria group bacterium]